MKKKFILIMILLISIFNCRIDVYADSCASLNTNKMTINAYIMDDETNEFEEYYMNRSYVNNGILLPFDYSGNGSKIMNKSSNKEAIYSDYTDIINGTYALSIPKKEGYNFDGWYLDKDMNKKANDESFRNYSSISELNITLYGRWTKDNINEVKDIYNIEENEAYIIGLYEKENSSCDIYAQYYYIPSNEYISNENGKITTLPIHEDLPDKKFAGWYAIVSKSDGTYDQVKVVNINDIKRVIETASYKGILWLHPKYVLEGEELGWKEVEENDLDVSTPEVISQLDSTNDNNLTNQLLSICIASCFVLAIMIVFIIIILKKNKKSNLDV